MSKKSWNTYWEGKINSHNRSDKDDFSLKLAQERLYHIGNGASLMDFGCGAGEVLQFTYDRFDKIVAIDFSKTMLEKAQEKINSMPNKNKVFFLLGNETNIWKQLDCQFDRIICAGVVQYFNKDQLRSWLDKARQSLNDQGKIIIFEILDPRIFYLFNSGLLKEQVNPLYVIYRIIRNIVVGLLRILQGKLPSVMGHKYLPSTFEKMAKEMNLTVTFVWSMYHGYRYHAIFKKNI